MFYVKFRIPIVLTLVVVTAVLGLGIPKMEKENGVKALLATDNSDYQFFEEMEDLFGATDQMVIGLTFNNSVYTEESLSIIDELTTFLEMDEFIEEEDVLSLASIEYIDGSDQELVVDNLYGEEIIPEDVQRKVRDSDMLRGKIVSSDEKSSVIIVTINSDVSFNGEILKELVTRVDSKILKLRERNNSVSIYRSGMVSVKHATSEYMEKDLTVMFPIAILIVMLILLVLLRSISGMIIPLLVTLFSVIWTLGLKGWLNSPLTMAETTIPIMLIAIGCADGVHIISEYLLFSRQGLSVKDAVQKTMKNLTLPVILTSLTTSLGFLSLITAPGVSVRNMGIFLGFGVLTAMLFSLLFIPAILSFRREKSVKKVRKTGVLDLSGSIRGVINNKFLVITISILFLTLSIIGMINVKVETDQVIFLKENNPLRLATEKIQQSLGGVNSLDVIISGDEDSLKDPEVLKFMENLQDYAEQSESVGYTLSLINYIKEINYQFMEKTPEYNSLPDSSAVISNLLFLYEMGGGEKLEKVVNDDYSMGKVAIRLNDTTQESIERLVDDLTIWINQNRPDNIETNFTNDYIRIVMGNLIVEGQIKSFITTLIAILLLLSIIFRSPVSGFLTALPVIIAVCFNFAIMWLTGTTLNIGTSIIASVGMGVGIDYSIHFFQRYKNIYLETGDNEQSIISAFNESLTPILSNALAVGIGFLTLLFSNYYIIAGIGWITALSMFTTAICALFVLPAFLALVDPLKRERSGISMKKGLIAMFLILPSVFLSSNDADEIMRKNFDLKKSDNSSNTTVMLLINKKGNKKTRKINMYSMETVEGENRFIEFLLPADVKGTKFLTIGYDEKDDDQRLFLPALKKVRKISSSKKDGKFMGSDLTYYDMESKNYDDFSYKLLREDSEFWIIESRSKDSNAPYRRSVIYISKTDYFGYTRELYDQKDSHIKTITVVETEVIDGIIIPVKTIIENFEDNHKTLLSVTDLKVNQGLDESIFTIQNLN